MFSLGRAAITISLFNNCQGWGVSPWQCYPSGRAGCTLGAWHVLIAVGVGVDVPLIALNAATLSSGMDVGRERGLNCVMNPQDATGGEAGSDAIHNRLVG